MVEINDTNNSSVIVDIGDIRNPPPVNSLDENGLPYFSNHAKWITYNIAQLTEFAHFVAKEVCRDNFEEDAGFFAEVACRKLNKLGIIQTDDENNWVYEFDVEEDEE